MGQRHRQAEAAVVVDVLTDQVHPARCREHPERRPSQVPLELAGHRVGEGIGLSGVEGLHDRNCRGGGGCVTFSGVVRWGCMRRPIRTTLGAAASAALATLLTVPAVAAAPPPTAATGPAQVQDFLANRLSTLGATGKATVLVHGTDLTAAKQAVSATGLATSTTFAKIGVVVARGTKSQIQAVRTQPGVTYLEGNQPIAFTAETSNTATRGDEALTSLTGADGTSLSGKGVSVGLIDSGVDPTHPYLTERTAPRSSSPTTRCSATRSRPPARSSTSRTAWTPTPVRRRSRHPRRRHHRRPPDHACGRFVAARCRARREAGRPLDRRGARHRRRGLGAQLGARAPRRSLWRGSPGATCPPIKVTNNSYGPTGGGEFDPKSATVKLQRALAAEGVMTVWANGNDGGDGSENLSNPPGQDPTGGIVSVASYNDLGTGTRDGEVSDFSSRGRPVSTSTYPDVSAPGD